MKIAIVGAGIGGLSAAIFLRRAGLDVDVYEQAPELTAVGAGLRLSPNGLRLLRRVGLGPDLAAVGVRPDVAWELRRWASGEIIWRGPQAGGAPLDHLLVHRAELLDLLLAHLDGPPPALGQQLVEIDCQDRIGLRFAGGTLAEADVLVGADGIHSLVCDRFMPARPPIASETSAFRATVPIEGTAFAEAAATARLWLGPDKHFVAYPISGGRLMNVLGVVPSTGREKESWSAAGDRDDLAASFAGWDPAVVEMIKNAEGVKLWALLSRAPLQRWTAGPIAVLGDAAHPMLPHLAQGACQAIEDAACLAGVLAEVRTAEEAAAALRRYETIRQPRASEIQLMAQNQGKDYHLHDGPAQRARDERLAAEGIRAQHWIYEHDAGAL
ncbi:FAD-dependent monooxygenase [Pseudonocardia sp. Cha107L01]|uniref:FAD-dependent monooxygenase n=1 Tax=Pseudonocardia sp. Cha107L01 TaxID=3457576 RepID=UPI00403EC80B